jgi:hypothetical protein
MAYNAFSRSALRQKKKRLLRPLLTSRSGWRRRPFRHKARSPQVRTQSFPAQPPDLRSLIFDHKSFAIFGSLALIGFALYPVLVHRLAVSIHASSPHSVALMQLRFTSFAVASLRRDFHPQDCAHAGRTKKRPSKGLLYSNQNHLVSQDSTVAEPCSAFHSFRVL